MATLTDGNPPRDGTKAAVTYWAARTREALRFAEALIVEGNGDGAEGWANDAAGCAGGFEIAVEAYVAKAASHA